MADKKSKKNNRNNNNNNDEDFNPRFKKVRKKVCPLCADKRARQIAILPYTQE